MSIATSPPSLEHIKALASGLASEDKLRLIDDLVHQLLESSALPTRAATEPETPKRAFPSLWGAIKDLGPAPSAEDIDDARRVAWANFAREESNG